MVIQEDINTISDKKYFGSFKRFSLVDTYDHQYDKEYRNTIFDNQTGDIYAYEEPKVLIGKFIAALSVLPLYAAGKAAYHGIALTYVIGDTLLCSCASLLKQVNLSYSKAVGQLGHHAVEIIRCGYYAAGISITLIQGIYNAIYTHALYAYETRSRVAYLEKEWSHNIPRDKDFRYYRLHEEWSKIDHCYLAFCFLPRGNLRDKIDSSESQRYTITKKADMEDVDFESIKMQTKFPVGL